MKTRTDVLTQRGYDYSRVTVYDWLRLIATIYVVIGHSAYLQIQTTFGGVMYELPNDISPFYYNSILSGFRFLSGWVYGFHMPLFFMLSGAVLALRPISSFDKVLKSKVKRLLIPYFVYGWLFMFPVKRFGNFYANDSLTLAMKEFLVGGDSGHLWFLTALFWCIIVFVLIVKILDKMNVTSVYVISIIAGTIYFLYSYIPFDVLGLRTGLSYIIYFTIGYIFEKERQENKRWNIKKTILACIVLISLEIIQKEYGILNSFFVILVGSLLTYILADLFDRAFPGAKNNRVWDFIVKNLFYVYLFHDPINYVVLRVFINGGYLKTALGCILYTVARTVGIFIASLVLGESVDFIKKKINILLMD